MIKNPEHPATSSRSRAPRGKAAKPPAAGPAGPGEVTGPRGLVQQAARDIKAGILDDDRRRIPDDVPGPRTDPERTQGADVRPERFRSQK